MHYYLCIVGSFDGNDEIVNDCCQRGIYQYYRGIHQKGPAGEISVGDVLILVSGKRLLGYGLSAGKMGDANGKNNQWDAVGVTGGWKLSGGIVGLPYGVYFNTVKGTKQSVVKEMSAMWASESIQKIKRSRGESVEELAFPVGLMELAIGLQEREGMRPFYDIPPVQRGLVWNAVRCEILWDSILRGIPIGTISVRPQGDHWEIFDGQQRTNAISLGYESWATTSKPLLWIDLDVDDAIRQKIANRRFVFRVTTVAHPWGYHLGLSEEKDTCLTTSEQKWAVAQISGLWGDEGNSGARPKPNELWPVEDVGCPVPFSVVREFVEWSHSSGRLSLGDFTCWCSRHYAKANWFRVNASEKLKTVNCDHWYELIEAIRKLSNYVVVALNARTVAEEDVGLYFKRMNKGGIEPDSEEIVYSQLKAKIGSLKCLDDVSIGRTKPSRLANLAIRIWSSRLDGWKWRASVTESDIVTIKGNPDDFGSFVKGEFASALKEMDSLLTHPLGGLLSWHIVKLYGFVGGDLAMYFIREILCQRAESCTPAIATWLLWFSLDAGTAVREMWKSKNPFDGLCGAFSRRSLLRMPQEYEIDAWFKDMAVRVSDLSDGHSWELLHKMFWEDAYAAPMIRRVWNGFHGEMGCELLLFACRRFVKRMFNGYDAASPEWREQNRPWDYDHILPQAWVNGGRRVSPCSYLVNRFLWSIGNSAPLPFSLNRGKNDSAPGRYPDGTQRSADELLVSIDEVANFSYGHFCGSSTKGWKRIDRCLIDSKTFVRITLDRCRRLVHEWYSSVGMGRIVQQCDDDSGHRLFIDMVRTIFPRIIPGVESTTYFYDGNRQYEVREPLDWCNAWLSCGIRGNIKDSEGNIVKCMLAVVVDGEDVKVGLLRHPEETSIGGADFWWVEEWLGQTVMKAGSIRACDTAQVEGCLKSVIPAYGFVSE